MVMKTKLSADAHLANFLPRLSKSQAVCLCGTKSVSMIPTNKAPKAVSRHIPQMNKMYRAATTKPMKGLASQPKQQPLFTVSLIFDKPLG